MKDISPIFKEYIILKIEDIGLQPIHATKKYVDANLFLSNVDEEGVYIMVKVKKVISNAKVLFK